MLQVIEQTKEEKMAMYMKQPKNKLAEMLIQCNEIIQSRPLEIYSLNCDHEFLGDIYWSSCTKCGTIKPTQS